ncbi:hypothetical protein E2C01_059005 [Portunus trituberculatus]|uniref:Secreted protein n=1 Tax=Portunus trituberculatus TaxID=210409 RepID=A0A5B7H476_PORTR|nr:hypothetical protein [Portunus trituberculatus]
MQNPHAIIFVAVAFQGTVLALAKPIHRTVHIKTRVFPELWEAVQRHHNAALPTTDVRCRDKEARASCYLLMSERVYIEHLGDDQHGKCTTPSQTTVMRGYMAGRSGARKIK